MSSSRAQSQSSRYSRKRSNTVQSAYKSNTVPAPPPLPAAPSVRVGESKTLAAWVHDPERSAAVIFNYTWWPGIDEGDLLRVTLGNSESGFLFFVPREDPNLFKPQLQVCPSLSSPTPLAQSTSHSFRSLLKISIPGNIAEVFGIRNNGEITVTKVRNEAHLQILPRLKHPFPA